MGCIYDCMNVHLFLVSFFLFLSPPSFACLMFIETETYFHSHECAYFSNFLWSSGNRSMQSKSYSEAIELYTCAIALCQRNAVYYCNRYEIAYLSPKSYLHHIWNSRVHSNYTVRQKSVEFFSIPLQENNALFTFAISLFPF